MWITERMLVINSFEEQQKQIYINKLIADSRACEARERKLHKDKVAATVS